MLYVVKNVTERLSVLVAATSAILLLNASKLLAIAVNGTHPLTELEILNCANCRLNVIEDYAFVNLRLLHSLYLRNNLLTTISNKTFAGLSENTIIY